jgi:type IV pilus assembly protein PilM
MSPIFGKNAAGAKAGGRPPIAVEITPEGVLAAARSGGKSEASRGHVYAFVPLPAGALVAGIEEPNLRAPDAVISAIRSAVAEVSPRSRAVTLVLPDILVRVFVLDFDSMPAKAAEAIPVVRFRLRKMIPFDVEHAGLGYQILKQDENECKVLAAVMPGPILAEYEAAIRSAGCEPGAVLPSSLAALEATDSMEAILAANLSTHAMTTSIANGRDLLLYRTIELAADSRQRAMDIQRGIAVAAAYFEDKLGSRPRQLYYAGIHDPADFARAVNDPALSVVDWVPRPDEGAMTALPQISFAGVDGALAGVS